MFLSRSGERNGSTRGIQILTIIALFLSAIIVTTSLPAEAKRNRSRAKVKQSSSQDKAKKNKKNKKNSKSSSQSSGSGMINPNTGLPLIAPIPEIYRTPVNQAPAQNFFISGSNQNKTSAAAGETVTMSLNVKSNIAASNVTVQFQVHVLGGAPEQIVEVRGLNFRAGQKRLVRATWKLRATDRVGRVFWSADVYHKGQKVASEWSSKDRSRGYHLMFRQTTGVGIFGSFDKPMNTCDDRNEIQIMPCALEGFLADTHLARNEAVAI